MNWYLFNLFLFTQVFFTSVHKNHFFGLRIQSMENMEQCEKNISAIGWR